MTGFVLHLQSPTQYERIADVESFVGHDASGSFGILARHERAMTVLAYGLARFRVGEAQWSYLALPGGLLYFAAGQLYVNTARYYRDFDYLRMARVLGEELRAEEEKVTGVAESFRNLERGMLQRLWNLQREERAGI